MVIMDSEYIDRSDGVCLGADFYILNSINSRFDTPYTHILMAYASESSTKFWLNSTCGG